MLVALAPHINEAVTTRGKRGCLASPWDESGDERVVHRRRNVSAAMEDAPDIHDIVADDVEHQIQEAGQRANAQAGNLELVGEAQTGRVR